MSLVRKTSYEYKLDIEDQLVLQNEAVQANKFDEAEIVAAKIANLRKKLKNKEVQEAKEAIREEQESIRQIYGGSIHELRTSTENKLGEYADNAAKTKEEY